MEAKQYEIRPSYKHKFPSSRVKELIKEVLATKLTGVEYQVENVQTWTKEIADEVKHKLKDLGLNRYKYFVQVVIGDSKGQGVRMGSRCFWDANTDSQASGTFTNENLFCSCVCFGVYLY